MEKQKQELDVNFIGGEKPLTKAEEQALSEFFKKKASTNNRTSAFSKVQQPPRKVAN